MKNHKQKRVIKTLEEKVVEANQLTKEEFFRKALKSKEHGSSTMMNLEQSSRWWID